MHRKISVTDSTTFDFIESKVHGDGWSEESTGVLDIVSPSGASEVALSLELDPCNSTPLDPHADVISLTPTEARHLATELTDAAEAAELGNTMVSGRRGQ